MKYLKVWTDFDKVIARLSDAEKGRLFVAMLHYAETGEEPSEFAGNEAFLWGVAKRDIDNAVAESAKRSINGSKGGRGNKAEESNEKQNKANESNENQTEANESRKEKKRKEKKGNEKENIKRFTPPTVEEVAAYCRERNNGINAQHFIDYYQQGNWILKNGRKMADWKAAVRTWEGNGYHNKPAIKTVPAQNYTQRDYSGEQAEAMARMLKGAAG